jgi:hypothetical protein
MATNSFAVPPGCAELLTPPADIADAWERFGERGRLVMSLSAAQTATETEFCYDLSLRMWHVVNTRPFYNGPSDVYSSTNPPDVASVEKWLWTLAHALKKRALTLDPNLPWPPNGQPTLPDWPWPR